MIALTVALAVFVGISLGLLGGGGSILTVPLLAYVAGLDPKQSIATSLLVVGVTSAFGAITHARAGRVRWKVAGVFGLAAMAGAYGGGRLAHFIPGNILLIAFALIMIMAAVAMLRGRKDVGDESAGPLPIGKILLQGVSVGMISGLVGAGGGFLLVPALALLGGLPMPVAVGTSLVVISMQSFAGFAGHLAGESIDWKLAGMVTGAAVVGSVIGGLLTSKIDPATLRKAFGWFVLAMAALVLAEEANIWLGLAVAIVAAVAGGMAFMCARYARCPLRKVLVDPGAIPRRVPLSQR
ncbi:MAG TPA: sulfite exporter TauE/SafE family protein [Mycobacterium sp.]|nr:sulfite exporter TauE/SafE family protein [Mycobacterium sp.]HQC75624.1 sulfite exporter TauE/SafE family protein [Mycobacterium sp.]